MGTRKLYMNDSGMDQQDDNLLRAVLGVNNNILGLVRGLIFGFEIFAATLWLVVKGGKNVGEHLGLLRQFFPGYRVTYLGSFVGLIYGFVTGYVAGWSIGWLYNRFVNLKGR